MQRSEPMSLNVVWKWAVNTWSRLSVNKEGGVVFVLPECHRTTEGVSDRHYELNTLTLLRLSTHSPDVNMQMTCKQENNVRCWLKGTDELSLVVLTWQFSLLTVFSPTYRHHWIEYEPGKRISCWEFSVKAELLIVLLCLSDTRWWTDPLKPQLMRAVGASAASCSEVKGPWAADKVVQAAGQTALCEGGGTLLRLVSLYDYVSLH